jgi:hypothetical protein
VLTLYSRRHLSFVGHLFALVLCVSVTSRASADERPRSDWQEWYGALDHQARTSVDRGLGFLRKFREPGKCKATVDELAGAMTSLSPEVLGAAVGLAVGAAAGAATTYSVFGALRGGILLGSIGSALGHLADVLMPDRVADIADNLQDLIQDRDGKVCELIKASDKLRAPVIDHLEASLERECQMEPGEAQGAALRGCLRDNAQAAAIFERHSSVLSTINRGTCRVAASLVRRFERGVARVKRESAGETADASLVPSCDEAQGGEAEAVDERDDARHVERAAPRRLAPNIL